MKKFTFTILTLILTGAFFYTNAQTWTENFEGDWTANWYVESGTWEVSEPTSGPDTLITETIVLLLFWEVPMQVVLKPIN